MAIQITITPKEKRDENSGLALSPVENQTNQDLSVESGAMVSGLASGMPNIASFLTPAFAIIAAKKAFDIAMEVRDKVIDLERDTRTRTDQMRRLGGSGFSPNALGERYNIFTESYVGGKDVSYRRR
jgi:hypothetical protein